MQRRRFLQVVGALGGAAAFGGLDGLRPLVATAQRLGAVAGPSPYGPLLAPDAMGFALPAGFTVRLLAVSGQPVAGTGYEWGIFPDGGACFPTSDGGWVYASNNEVPGIGGVQSLRFSSSGELTRAYRVAGGTTLNCAGGRMGRRWLSCEEYPAGLVWETDPYGRIPAIARPAMGRFQHEAVAVSLRTRRLYLTEDVIDGRFYRFTPTTWPDLSNGRLDVMAVDDAGFVTWHEVPDPDPDLENGATPTRYQVEDSAPFLGGEGICVSNGRVYFTTKFDNRVWEYRPGRERIRVLYDGATDPGGVIRGIDNIIGDGGGDLFVCEDPGGVPFMQIVVITADGAVAPVVAVHGQSGSELTGVAFDPSGTRMYFSSQRGGNGLGATYEVTGPFRHA